MGLLADIFGGRRLAKAVSARPQEKPPATPKSHAIDPRRVDAEYAGEVPTGYHPGTVGMDYTVLHSMSRIPVISAVIQTRIQQVAEFAQPQPSPYSIGFRIRLRDAKATMTRAAENTAEDISKVIMRAGGQWGPDSFETALRMLTRDSMTYDQANFEVLRERGGLPWGFVPVDAATVRFAKLSAAARAAGRPAPKDIAYVQVVDNKIKTDWKRHEMAFGVRRPRTWIQSRGYGFPELEELLTVTTNLLNAETYNAVNFTSGVHASTILTLKSRLDDRMFRAFKRNIVAMLSGVHNAKRVPIIQLDPEGNEDLKSTPLGAASNKDMEYSNWINWLLKVVCACYSMDPAELGFVFGNEGQTAALSQHGPGERLSASKERGLRPVLRAIQHWLTMAIVIPYDEDFCLEFTGFDSLSEKEKQDLDVQAVKSFKTVDEIRTEHDLKKFGPPLGDLILDPTFFQAWQQIQAQEEEGGGEPELGGPGDLAEFEPGEPPQDLEVEASQGIDQITTEFARRASSALSSGALVRKAHQKGPWVPRVHGRKAYVVEV